MGLFSRGRWLDVPWNQDFDQHLMKVSETTYRNTGDELLHEIHKTAIEGNHINMWLHRKVMRILWAILAVGIAILVRGAS